MAQRTPAAVLVLLLLAPGWGIVASAMRAGLEAEDFHDDS